MSTLTVEYREFSQVKPGGYRARIKALTRRASQFREGEQAVVVEFEIQDGEHRGRVLRKTYSQRLTPRAKLTALVSRLMGPLKDGQVVDLLQLIGRECEIVVVTGEGQDGRTFAKIADVFALEGGDRVSPDGS